MFEAQNPAPNATHSVAGRQNQNPAQPQTSARPVGAVEDIFAGTDAEAASAVSPLPQAGERNALNIGKLKPVAGQSEPEIPLSQLSGQSGARFPFKKFIAIIGIVAGIAAIAGVLYFIWKSGVKTNTPAQTSAPALDANKSAEASQGAEDADDSSAANQGNQSGAQDDSATDGILENFQEDRINRALNPIPEDLASKDTDLDGLTDAKEYDLGTNPRLVDSDSDGLSDWEEESIFGTDPLNKDSDNDTYLDGEEVQNGYNPLGPGKLLNFEQAK